MQTHTRSPNSAHTSCWAGDIFTADHVDKPQCTRAFSQESCIFKNVFLIRSNSVTDHQRRVFGQQSLHVKRWHNYIFGAPVRVEEAPVCLSVCHCTLPLNSIRLSFGVLICLLSRPSVDPSFTHSSLSSASVHSPAICHFTLFFFGFVCLHLPF